MAETNNNTPWVAAAYSADQVPLMLTPAQEEAVQKIRELSPKQRAALRTRIEGMPAEQRASVEETLRLYTQQEQAKEAQENETAAMNQAAVTAQAAAPAGESPTPQPKKTAKPTAQAVKKTKTKQPTKQKETQTLKPPEQMQAPRQAPQGERDDAAASAQATPAAIVSVPKAGKIALQTHLRRFAETMQRGANDAALVEARKSSTLPPRLIYNAMGQSLYSVGLQTEYTMVRFLRAVQSGSRAFLRSAGSIGGALLRPLQSLGSGLVHDTTEPAKRIFSGLRNTAVAMRQATKQGENPWAASVLYVKQGITTHRKLLLSSLSYLMPLGALAVFLFTVMPMVKQDYSLAVNYQGEFLAFVENESVWEDAQKMVLSRMRAGSSEDFAAYPELTVRAVNPAARTGAPDLANRIVEASSDQIKNATGVMVNDTLLGVCADTVGVQRVLDNAIAKEKDPEDPNMRIEFLQNVTMVTGVYLSASVMPLAQLESDLNSGGYLQVKTVRTTTYEEALAFETIETESDKYYKGTRRTQQRGKNGLQEVTADITYVDGVEVERVVLSTTVLQEATPQLVSIGTKAVQNSYNGTITPGTGSLVWPVPEFTGMTTQFGQGGHRGVDIRGNYGAAVLACDTGTVVEAGRHYSWGNYIKINHGNGMETLYAHNSALLVGVGQTVSRGSLIAQVGSTGNSSGNHLHLELYINGRLTNPRNYIG